jgi:long-chain acyl-CoA synthetase
MSHKTITAAFAATVAARPDTVALRTRAGDGNGTLTWAEYGDAACRMAAGLRDAGLRPGERVALMLRNRPEFHVADMGILLAGGTPVSIYNSSPPDRMAYVMGHAETRFAVVEDAFVGRCRAARATLPELRTVVSLGAGGDVSFGDLLGASPVDLEGAAAAVAPDDRLTIIYTSGTTGDPKGVMLTHANLAFAVDTYRTVLGRSLEGLRQVSFLPMAHIAERLATHYFHVCEGSDVTTCDDLAALVPTMVAVQPEWFFSAPRLWEKLQAGLETMVAADPAAAEDFAAARALGWRAFLAARDGSEGADAALAGEWAATRAQHVTPWLEKVGLGRVLIALTGAAPIPQATSEFFLSLGVPLSEVWGMSETSGLGTWSPHRIVPGTTGRPVPGVQIRLGGDDEILVRGPCVFGGYLHDPERSADVLDADGWLHTGDIGRFDPEGNLAIVDRKKDLIVPSSGHNVSPAQLEARLKECPLIGQACVVGDRRPHVAALLLADPDVARSWGAGHGLDGAPLADIAAHPDFRTEIDAFVAGINATVPPAERIVAFAVLGEEWLPDSDVLTPTAKLKRRAINVRYADLIDALYTRPKSTTR